MLVMSLYNIIDTFWVSGLPNGTQAIAALTILFPIQMLAGALGMGTGVGVASLVSRRSGENRLDEVNDVGGHAVVLSVLLGTTIGAICLTFPRGLVLAFGAHSSMVEPAVAYLTTVAFGFPFQLFAISVNGLYRGSGNTVTPMAVMVSSAGMNLLLDPFLIYGWGPFPALGIQGAALATAISQATACLLSASYLWSGRSGYAIGARNLRLRVRTLRDIAQVGAPAAVMCCARPLVGTVFNWVLRGYGPEAIAAQGLAHRVMMLAIPFLGGVHQGLLPIVGYNFGAKNYRRMWKAFLTAGGWTTSLAVCLGAAAFLAAPSVIGIFTKDPKLLELGVLALRIKVVTLFLIEAQMMCISTLQGIGRGSQAMVLTLMRQVALVLPLLFVLPRWLGIGGVFASQPGSDLVAIVITAAYMRRVYREYPPLAAEELPRAAAAASAETGGDA